MLNGWFSVDSGVLTDFPHLHDADGLSSTEELELVKCVMCCSCRVRFVDLREDWGSVMLMPQYRANDSGVRSRPVPGPAQTRMCFNLARSPLILTGLTLVWPRAEPVSHRDRMYHPRKVKDMAACPSNCHSNRSSSRPGRSAQNTRG